MNFKKLILFPLLFFLLQIKAQNIKFTQINSKGQKFPKEIRCITYKDAFKIGSNYYIVGIKQGEASLLISAGESSDFIVYRFDSAMNILGTSTIQGEIENKKTIPHALKHVGDDLMAFFYINDSKADKQYLIARKIDLETFEPEGQFTVLAETRTDKKRDRFIPCIFNISVSPDRSKLFITAGRANIKVLNSLNDNTTLEFWQYNSDLKLIASRNTAEIRKDIGSFICQVTDNEGNIAALGFVTVFDGPNFNLSPGNSILHSNNCRLILQFAQLSSKIKDITLSNGDFFYSAQAKLNDATGNLMIIGIKHMRNEGALGIYYAEFNLSTGTVVKEQNFPFSDSILHRINSLKPSKSAKDQFTYSGNLRSNLIIKNQLSHIHKGEQVDLKYIPNLTNINAFYTNDKGEITFVCQKFYMVSINSPSDAKGNSTTEVYPVYGDLITFKSDSTGAISSFGYAFNLETYNGFEPINFYKSIYAGNVVYVYTKNSCGEIYFNDSATDLTPKKFITQMKSEYLNQQYFNISDSEMVLIYADNGKTLFSILKPKED